jgi:hypothetical protein
MTELRLGWALVRARPVESVAALAALLGFMAAVFGGLPLLAVGLGWA